MPIPKCPEKLPNELSDLITQFAKIWAKSEVRPKPSNDICDRWERLLEAWINDDSLPLFARKSSLGRGKRLPVKGRIIIPCDNSPAQWAYSLACQNECPCICEVRAMLGKSSAKSEQIPVAMIFSREDKQDSLRYGVKLNTESNVNLFGWKLGHIEKIGLRKPGDVSQMDLDLIKKHHKALLNPKNMFLIPKQWAGLAEIDEVASSIQEHNMGLRGNVN